MIIAVGMGVSVGEFRVCRFAYLMHFDKEVECLACQRVVQVYVDHFVTHLQNGYRATPLLGLNDSLLAGLQAFGLVEVLL